MHVDIGAELAGRYRLEERLAVGGMGEVWCAVDTLLDRPVAVKMPRVDLADDPAFADRLLSEARHSAAVGHPGIAAVYDVDGDGPVPYLVMELVEGRPLSRLLADEGPLPADRARHVICQVAAALDAAHDAGLIHRDIKPANLLVTADDTVKVTDFGIARAVDASTLTRTGFVVGTAQYLSPERACGEPASAASDLYALGVVAYECLAGHRPFDGAPLEVLRAHRDDPVPPLPDSVPDDLRALTLSLLEKDPARRPTARHVVSGAGADDGNPATRLLPVHAPASRPADDVPAGDVPAADVVVPAPPPPRPWSAGGARTRVAAAAVASVLALLVMTAGADEPDTSSPQASGGDAAPAAPETVPVSSARLFHPGGSGQDHAEQVPLAIDGDPLTAWTTQHYASPEFGNLRPGVGLVFDLGRPTAVREVRVALAFAGADVRVHAGDNADPTLLDTPTIAVVPDAPAGLVVTPEQEVTARFWLVWFEQLPESGSRHQAGIADVAFLAA